MSKRSADSTPKQNPKRRKLSDKDLLEAVRNGHTAAVRAALEKLSPGSKTETVAFEAVHEACRGNHNECLTLLLPYVETTQMGFGILLSECVHADHTACTEVLLQHWKSVCSNVAFVPHDSKDSAGQTEYLCPVMWEDPAVCQVFIGAGADIETKNSKGRSPLHLASISGELTTVKMLVEAGADVRATDAARATCLIFAASNGHTDTVRYLVGFPEVDLNHRGCENYTALHVAVAHADVVQVLIDAGADIETKNTDGHSPLLLASLSGELTTVKMLVEAGADVRATDDCGSTCLLLAAFDGHTDTVRYLVSVPEVDLNHQDSDNCTALHLAVEENHPDMVQVLIDAGADIETKDSDGSTCLFLAVGNGQTDIVRYLVGLPEVDLHQQGNRNDVVLHLAVSRKHADVVKVLIAAGADVGGKYNGRSPLHIACASGALANVKMLVEAGADVSATDPTRETCLIIAAYHGHTEIVSYLVGLPEVDLNHHGSTNFTALHFAVQYKHADVVQLLIDAGADVNAIERNGQTCFFLAVGHGHTDIVRYLVGLPEVDLRDQGSKNYLALHLAVQKKHADVVKILIDAGADIEGKHSGCSPLQSACDSGVLANVKLLVEAGADVRAIHSEGTTCLMRASHDGQTDIVRYLASLPAVDLNRHGLDNYTSLHFAVKEKHADVVQVLIDAGADIQAKDCDGRSPLHVACGSGPLAIVKMLIEAGADIRATDSDRTTCLLLASHDGQTEIVRYLASLPAVDLNHRGINNFTALHFAVLKKRPGVVKVLIDAGADIQAKDSEGCSPLHVASCSGPLAIVKMLIEAGADIRATDSSGATCLMLAKQDKQTDIVHYLVTCSH